MDKVKFQIGHAYYEWDAPWTYESERFPVLRTWIYAGPEIRMTTMSARKEDITRLRKRKVTARGEVVAHPVSKIADPAS